MQKAEAVERMSAWQEGRARVAYTALVTWTLVVAVLAFSPVSDGLTYLHVGDYVLNSNQRLFFTVAALVGPGAACAALTHPSYQMVKWDWVAAGVLLAVQAAVFLLAAVTRDAGVGGMVLAVLASLTLALAPVGAARAHWYLRR